MKTAKRNVFATEERFGSAHQAIIHQDTMDIRHLVAVNGALWQPRGHVAELTPRRRATFGSLAARRHQRSSQRWARAAPDIERGAVEHRRTPEIATRNITEL